MLPLEYTMVREDETVFGIAKMIERDIAAQGIPLAKYFEMLESEIARNPLNPVPYAKKSFLLQRSTYQAVEVVERGLKAVGDNHLLYHCRGMAYEHAGQRSRALEDFKRAVEIYPIATETIVTLGTLLTRDKRYDEAMSYWDRLIELSPEMFMAWNGKARIEFEIGDYQNAINHATAATFCQPEQPVLHENLGKILFAADRFADGLREYETAANLDGEKRKIASEMKVVTKKLLLKKRYWELAQIYEKANELDPGNVDTLMGLAGVYGGLGETDKEIHYLDELYSASEKTDIVPLLELTATALGNAERLREAAHVTERLYRMTNDKSYLINLAQMAMALDDRSLIEPYMAEISSLMSQKPRESEFKAGRNDPCPCGSGQKFKKCHGSA